MGEGQTVNFLYNAGGQRMVKIGNSRSVLYQIIDGVAVGESINDGQTVIYYLFDEKGDVYGLNVNGSEYFLRKNLQGDVIGIWQDEGPQVVTYTYDPWGKLLSMTDSTNIGVGTLNPFRYRSYYYDIETGLYYLQSRYYDPEIGRFINADGQLNNDILGCNMFAYCENNPVNLVDYYGDKPGDLFDTTDEAAIDAAKYLGELTWQNWETAWEYATVVYSVVVSRKERRTITTWHRFLWWTWATTETKTVTVKYVKYTYTEARTDKSTVNVRAPEAPPNKKTLAVVHTHPFGIAEREYTEFSPLDKKTTKRQGLLYCYVYGPDGNLKKYNSALDKITLVCSNLPTSPYPIWAY